MPASLTIALDDMDASIPPPSYEQTCKYQAEESRVGDDDSTRLAQMTEQLAERERRLEQEKRRLMRDQRLVKEWQRQRAQARCHGRNARSSLEVSAIDRHLSPDTIYKQLKTYEMDLPKHVLCSSCACFHRRPGPGALFWVTDIARLFRPPGWYYDIGGQECSENNRSVKIGLTGKTGFSLDWWLVHLVMRSYRLSSRHGISIKSLSRRYKCCYWDCTVKARICGGHLLIRTRNYRAFNREFVKKGFDEFPSCIHAARSSRLRRVCEDVVSDFEGAKNQQNRQQNPVYRCYLCPSEYTVEIARTRNHREDLSAYSAAIKPEAAAIRRECIHRRQEIPKEYVKDGTKIPTEHVLILSHWIDLGTCESTNSKEWCSLMTARPSPPRSELGTSIKPYNIGRLPSISSRFENTFSARFDSTITAMW